VRLRLVACAFVVLLVVVAACSTPTPTATPTPPPTATPPPPTATPQPTEPPVLQSVAGDKAFNNYCAGCHPSGIATQRLIRYRTADNLFEFLRMNMPPGNPESVAVERHYEITAYLLANAGLMDPEQTVDPATAASILLTAPGEPAKPEQVIAGEKAFNRYCGGCHGGGFSKSRIARFGTAAKLFSFLRISMPPGNPEQLTEQQHYDIAAYLLSVHDFLEAGEVVGPDSAESVTFGN